LTLLTIAVPHALLLVTLEAATRYAAWRTNHQLNTFFCFFLAALLVVPGAVVGWVIRGRSLRLTRWLQLAGLECALAYLFCVLAVISGLHNFLVQESAHPLGLAVDIAFCAVFFAPFLSIFVLAMTERRKGDAVKIDLSHGAKKRIQYSASSFTSFSRQRPPGGLLRRRSVL